MKKLYYLIILTVILGLVLTGCSLLSNVGQVPTTGQSGVTYLTKGGPTVVTLFAGKDEDVGTVTVSDDGTNLTVIYNTTGNWVMTETHLAVADSLAGIPQTQKGNPIPGKFPYSAEHDPAVNFYSYEIPLDSWGPCPKLFIAAHAKVVRPIEGCWETVWQIGDVETPTCGGDLTNYANEFNWKKEMDLSGSYILPVGDCEQGPGLNSNKPLFTTPFIVGTSFDEFPYNSNYKKSYAADFDVEWNGSLPFGGSLTISWSPPNAQTYTKVISGSGIPSPEIITVLGYQAAGSGWYMDLYPLVSNSVEIDPLPDGLHTINLEQTEGGGTFWDWVLLEKPCEQEETAWADGVRFVDRGNWGMYFEYVTVEPYSFADTQPVSDGTVGDLVTTVAEDGDWMVWTFDFPVEVFTGNGNLSVGLIVALDGEGKGPKFQIHNNDGADSSYPWGTWLMSPWGPTIGDGWMGWHSGDTNTPVTSLSWVEAIGQRNTPWEGIVSGDGVMEIRIKKSELGNTFHWAASPTVGTGFWAPASDVTMQIPAGFGWGTPLVDMSVPNYIAR